METQQAVAREFEWRQPKALHRFHQLLSNGEEVGTFRFEKSYSSQALGQYGRAQWIFKRTGFLRHRILVREVGAETDLAEFTPTWAGSGSVTFRESRQYQMKHTNFWRSEWAFEGSDGKVAVTLAGPKGGLHHTGIATVAEGASGLPETPVLIMLLWYVRLLANEDAAAATSASF